MYDELVKRLWECASGECFNFSQYTETTNASVCSKELMKQAADAIEELSMKLHGDEAAIAGMKREIERMVVAGKPRWIPVTERLPEHDRNVLICYEWTGRSGTVYREVGIASIEELERDPTELFRPLYWMPLPEPPEEET